MELQSYKSTTNNQINNKMKGILLDADGEIQIENGSMKIGNVDAQIAEHIISAFQGEYKEAPLLGGNVRKMLNGAPDPFWSPQMRQQLKTQHLNAEIRITRDGDFFVKLK